MQAKRIVNFGELNMPEVTDFPDFILQIIPKDGIDDLVLPNNSMFLLRELVIQMKKQRRNFQQGKFEDNNREKFGITVIFLGINRKKKIMAAEALATELHMDLFRIDLSQVVNKYVGETEKNLRKVFDAAEDGGAILFFDEADSLFGSRSEVRDSHDRYGNIEISYLLERVERYKGLAILATNRKEDLDDAFIRRIRFIVDFSLPDTKRRIKI